MNGQIKKKDILTAVFNASTSKYNQCWYLHSFLNKMNHFSSHKNIARNLFMCYKKKRIYPSKENCGAFFFHSSFKNYNSNPLINNLIRYTDIRFRNLSAFKQQVIQLNWLCNFLMPELQLYKQNDVFYLDIPIDISL